MVRSPFDWTPATPSRELPLPSFSDTRPATAATVTIRVRRSAADRRTTLCVAGEVDLASVGVLRAAISAVLASSSTELWIDLSEVVFMDSSGLHLLVDAHHEVSRLDRRLAIVCPPGAIRRLFEITALDEVLPLHDDSGSAARCVRTAA
jgi:anti-sigma B factor antagonist